MDQKQMTTTYYCPTHGDSSVLKPIEITKEIRKISKKKFILKLIFKYSYTWGKNLNLDLKS